MKIKRCIFLLISLLFIILLPSIVFFVSNLSFSNNFIFANNINKNLEIIFKNNDLLKVKKADYFYKMWEYEKAYKKYNEIKCENKDLCFIINHNIWNTTYKIWEKLNNLDKLNFWQKSLSYYLKALEFKYDKQTKKNYDFVSDKLNKLKQEIKKENKKQEEKQDGKNEKWDSDKKENQNNNEQNNWEEKKNENQNENVTPKWPSMNIDDDKNISKKPLSKEEKKQLEDYIKWLKQEEKQNLEFNKLGEDRDIFDILQEDFFTPFDQKGNDW